MLSGQMIVPVLKLILSASSKFFLTLSDENDLTSFVDHTLVVNVERFYSVAVLSNSLDFAPIFNAIVTS
jgi:hypothetical protein